MFAKADVLNDGLEIDVNCHARFAAEMYGIQTIVKERSGVAKETRGLEKIVEKPAENVINHTYFYKKQNMHLILVSSYTF